MVIVRKRSLLILLSLLVALAIVACSAATLGRVEKARSIRPIVKIGLIAPFEGIYRRTGYEALAATRAALSDHQELMRNAGIDLLPLALDDSGDPQSAVRTTQKLLADPAVGALVGPISPWSAQAAADKLSASTHYWERPYLAGQSEERWFADLLTAINQAAQQQGAERLFIVGWRNRWPLPKDEGWKQIEGLPFHFVEGNSVDEVVELVERNDAVLFLGTPADAAATLSALRLQHETVPFWMGPTGGDPIFFERASRVDHVYWAAWLDGEYEEWTTIHSPKTPSAYLVYQSTKRAIYAVITPATPADQKVVSAGKVHLFSIQADGVSVPYQY